MKRRALLLSGLCLSAPVLSQVPLPTLAALGVLVKVIGEAGDALSKVTKGISDLVNAGNDSYNYLSAKRDRERLIKLSGNLQKLVAGSNAAFIDYLQLYISRLTRYYQDNESGAPSVSTMRPIWDGLLNQAHTNLEIVHAILTDLNAEKSDFVLKPAYLGLQEVLHSRTSVLLEMKSMPPPVSKEELRMLMVLRENYKKLRMRTFDLIGELNRYLEKSDDKS